MQGITLTLKISSFQLFTEREREREREREIEREMKDILIIHEYTLKTDLGQIMNMFVYTYIGRLYSMLKEKFMGKKSLKHHIS